MTLKVLEGDFSVCQAACLEQIKTDAPYCFIGKTAEELSLVCLTGDAPREAVAREDGWRGLKIEGVLDFSLIGILAKLSAVLAENEIGIFAVSTYNTDYIFVKAAQLDKAVAALKGAGYTVA